jgi:hypothetical protein
LYGKLLNSIDVPNWVFGGEYGDITKLLANREMANQAVEQKDLLLEESRREAEDRRRRDEYQESLGDTVGTGSLRDMYQRRMKKALETGNADIAAQLEEKLIAFDEREKDEKLKDRRDALKMSSDFPFEAIDALYPGALMKDVADKIYRDKRKPKEAKQDVVEMYNLSNGVIEYVPKQFAVPFQKAGTHRLVSDKRFSTEEPPPFGGMAESEETVSKPWWKVWGDNPPAGVNQSRGDRAGMAPGVQDRVKTIIRKRKEENASGRVPRG